MNEKSFSWMFFLNRVRKEGGCRSKGYLSNECELKFASTRLLRVIEKKLPKDNHNVRKAFHSNLTSKVSQQYSSI